MTNKHLYHGHPKLEGGGGREGGRGRGEGRRGEGGREGGEGGKRGGGREGKGEGRRGEGGEGGKGGGGREGKEGGRREEEEGVKKNKREKKGGKFVSYLPILILCYLLSISFRDRRWQFYQCRKS